MKIILHEGKDDKKYIKRVCEYLNIEVSDENFYEMGSKSTFFKEDNPIYSMIKNDPRVEKILFVIDADYKKDNSIYGGYENSQRELIKIIDNLELKSISDFYIACDPKTKDGYFETLFYSCVPEDLKKCYNSFMDCSKFKAKQNYKTIITKLHELSSPSKPYSFDHENFDELKEKLINLFN